MHLQITVGAFALGVTPTDVSLKIKTKAELDTVKVDKTATD